MLKNIYHAYVYGDRKNLIITGVLINLVFCVGTYLIVAPRVRNLPSLRTQVITLDHDVLRQKTFLASENTMHSHKNLSMIDLGAQFNASMITQDHQFYLAGNTSDMVALLKWILEQAYPIQALQMNIHGYKTSLVISP